MGRREEESHEILDRCRVYVSLLRRYDGLTLDALAGLTDAQIFNLLCAPEEPDSEVEHPDGGADNPFLNFWMHCRQHGKSDEETVALWHEFHPDEPELAVIDPTWKWVPEPIETIDLG